MTKTTECTVKRGAEAGATYHVHKRLDWGKPRFSVDPELTGWHPTATAARLAAETSGYAWRTSVSGNRVLVHSSVSRHYQE